MITNKNQQTFISVKFLGSGLLECQDAALIIKTFFSCIHFISIIWPPRKHIKLQASLGGIFRTGNAALPHTLGDRRLPVLIWL